MPKPKNKKYKCKICGNEYEKLFSSTQKVCGLKCAKEYGSKAREKAYEARKRKLAREIRDEKERLKTRSDWLREAQREFNRFIRLRDSMESCISCGRSNDGHHLTGGSYDCGHYRSVGANPELRFEELNAHKQCKQCNRDLSGNHVNYRIRLIERIGQESVDWLEGPHEPKNYTIDDIKEIKKKYAKKARELEKSLQDRL